jgi:hypothetical protein
MIAFQVLLAVLAMGLDQLIQSRYGGLGVLGLFLLGVGIKARSTTCSSLGAVMLVLLLTQA